MATDPTKIILGALSAGNPKAEELVLLIWRAMEQVNADINFVTLLNCALIEQLVDQVRAERDQVQEENKHLAAQLDAVREILDGADTAEGPLAERYAERLTRIGKAIRRWNGRR